MSSKNYLKEPVRHISLYDFNPTILIESYSKMSFQARNLARAAKIYRDMLGDNDCSIWLCLAGSLFSAGLKKVVMEMVRENLVDVIVSTGAIMVDQDFFEGLGFKHYIGSPKLDDGMLRENSMDRIYDTLISEDDLRVCDMKISEIAGKMEPGAVSSRRFIQEMGKYLNENHPNCESVVLECYRNNVPIFVPAFSDCSAGFGLIHHQHNRGNKPSVGIDSVKDFYELTKIKVESKDSGLFMVGGGVPKNFAQDTPVAADIIGLESKMHKYAIQITVADERDGALSGSTLEEAHSWGKVDLTWEQMVYCEATIAMPLIAGYGLHSGLGKKRVRKSHSTLFD